MPQLETNGITVEYDTFGDEGARPLLLVMGLGAQMIAWDEQFCGMLADNGHFVIRFDNRDVGLSTKLHDAPVPAMEALVGALMAGETPDVPYTLDHMADDAAGVLDALGIDAAHVAGASLGGMIVQTMGIRHGQRLKSITSIMSTTGSREVPPATPEAMGALTSPTPADLEGFVERSLRVGGVIGSPGFERDLDRARSRAELAFHRCVYPEGSARQMAAVIAHGDRSEALRDVDVPTLVIHGDADPLVHPDGGRKTAEVMPRSELLMIEGMGNDLPLGAWDRIVDAMSRHTEAHH
jgi:pimeloyl-ACP methyl ester carboxylesterase